MNKQRIALIPGLALGAAPVIGAAPLTPYAQGPTQGQLCQVWHATAQDSSGQTLTCVHGVNTGHLMYWEYGGQTDNPPPGWGQ